MSAEILSVVLLLVHLAATLYMTGLVWFVQVVHYPLFAHVDGARFQSFERAHLERTRPVVGPPMLAEALTGAALLVWAPSGVPLSARLLGAALLAGIWLSTWRLQVPVHERLARRFDPADHRRLVGSNWIRTAAWTLRSALVLWMALRAAV